MSSLLDAYQSIQNMQVANQGRTTTPTPTSRGAGGGSVAQSVNESYGEDEKPISEGGEISRSLNTSVINPTVASETNQGNNLSTIKSYIGTGNNVVGLVNTAAKIGSNIAAAQGATEIAGGLTQASNVLGKVGAGASYLLTAYNAYQVAANGPGEGRGANLAISTLPYVVKALTPTVTSAAAGGGSAAVGGGTAGSAGSAGGGGSAAVSAGAIAAAAAASIRQGYLSGTNRMSESTKGSNKYAEGDIQSTPFSLVLDLGLGARMQRQGGVTTPTSSFMALPRDFERTAYASLENVFSGRISDSMSDWRDFAKQSTYGNVKNAIDYYRDNPGKFALAGATAGVSEIFDSLF